MGAEVPKQYLSLRGRPVIAHALERLALHPCVRGVVVVLAADDVWWPTVRLHPEVKTLRADGGRERCHSVLNGLRRVRQETGAGAQDRVLVHDAVRPCVRGEDIERLIEGVRSERDGGLLGLPVRDTMKRTNAADRVEATVSREGLWHALTPQLFPLEALMEALERCVDAEIPITDEAQAMELAGASPRMVEGHSDNIKITRPGDLRLAEVYLDAQEAQA